MSASAGRLSRTPPVGERRRSPSPPPRRPRHRDVTGRDAIVKEAGVQLRNPTLTRTNYAEWAVLMRVNMQAQGVWEAIEPGGAEYRVDRMALAAILQAVPSEMVVMLAAKDSAQEAWNAVKAMRLGAERAHEAKAQTLRREFELIRMKEGETVNDFSLRITSLVGSLSTLGDPIEEDKVVKKFLRIVTTRFTQVAIAIESTVDLSTLTVEELTGRLRSVKERYGLGESDEYGGQLLLTEEEWKARSLKHDSEGSSDCSSCHACGKSHVHRRFDKAKVRCYNCNDYGHFASECRKPKKEEKGLLAEAQSDDELTLL